MGNIADFIASLKRKIAAPDDVDISTLPFENDKIAQIMEYYQLNAGEIYKLYHVFRKMDREGSGYINLDNLYNLINEEIGIISPYLERFFGLIEKQHKDKVNFVEFIPVLATFCLFTKEQLSSFVFAMLDHDNDGYISKKDMLQFASTERFGLPIFPQNFLISIDSVEVDRADKISIQLFMKIEQEILFLIYPAVRLQQNLRREFGGEDMWEHVYKRLLQAELEQDKKQQQQNFNEDLRRKRAQKSEQKKIEFEKMLKEKFFVKRFISDIKNLPVREQRRRGSDSRVSIKLDPLIQAPRKRHNSQLYYKKPFVIQDNNKDNQNQQIPKTDNPVIPSHLKKIKERETQKTAEKRRGSRSITVSEGKKLALELSNTPKKSQDSNRIESNNSSRISQLLRSGEKLAPNLNQQIRRPSMFRSSTAING